MPSPSTTLASQRPDLASSFEEFDIEMQISQFGAMRLAPVIECGAQAGNFGKIPIAQLAKTRDTKRSSGGAYNRGGFKFDPVTYSTEEHGVEEPIDRREAAMYADYFDAELVASRRARWAVMANYEQRVCDLCSSTTTWTGASLTTAVSTPWSTVATATPIADIRAAKLKVRDAGGAIPNALVVSWKRFQTLKDCAEIIDRVKYAGFQDPTRRAITAEALAAVFDLDMVIVMGGVKDAAVEGAAFSGSGFWDDTKALVCKVAMTTDPREVCVARTFHWSADGSQVGGTLESYYDETVRSDVIRCRMETDEKVMYAAAAHLLTSV